jgi:hypothetical protein
MKSSVWWICTGTDWAGGCVIDLLLSSFIWENCLLNPKLDFVEFLRSCFGCCEAPFLRSTQFLNIGS